MWVLLDVALAVAGLVVLAALTVRLFTQVRQLGRDVGAAARRLSEATAELERVAPQPRR